VVPGHNLETSPGVCPSGLVAHIRVLGVEAALLIGVAQQPRWGSTGTGEVAITQTGLAQGHPRGVVLHLLRIRSVLQVIIYRCLNHARGRFHGITGIKIESSSLDCSESV